MVRTAHLENMGGLIPAHANIFIWLEGKRYIVETQPGAMAGTLFDLHPGNTDTCGEVIEAVSSDEIKLEPLER